MWELGIGQRIRALREEAGMTLQEVIEILGDQLGIRTRNALSLWEREQTSVPDGALKILCDYYGVSADYVLGRKGAQRDAPDVKQVQTELQNYLRLTEDRLDDTTPEERVAAVWEFLGGKHLIFSLNRVARRLVISADTLEKIVAGSCQAGPVVIQQFAAMAGIPESWFYVPEPRLAKLDLEPYRKAIELAYSKGFTPTSLEEVLRLLAPQA